jgi:hypothetical protein
MSNFRFLRYIASLIAILCCLTLPLTVDWVPSTTRVNNTLTHVRSMHPSPKVSLDFNKNEEIDNDLVINQLNEDAQSNTNYLGQAENTNRKRSKLRLDARSTNNFYPSLMLSASPYANSGIIKALSLDSSSNSHSHTLYGNIPEACKTDSNSTLIYNFFELHVLLFHIAVLSCASFIQLYFYYKLVLMFLAVMIYLIGFYMYNIYECLAESMLINQPFLRTELALEMLFYVIFLHLIDRRV